MLHGVKLSGILARRLESPLPKTCGTYTMLCGRLTVARLWSYRSFINVFNIELNLLPKISRPDMSTCYGNLVFPASTC